MNIFINIDPAWSHNFFAKCRDRIAKYDYFVFYDRFFNAALNYLKAHIEFNNTNNPTSYQHYMAEVCKVYELYPDLSEAMKVALFDLYRIHYTAFLAVETPITNQQTVIDDNGILIGILYCTDNRSNLKPILQ